MTTDNDGLPLAAAISAAELARLRRRLVFLEAALVQVLRDERRVREWFSAGDLAALRLPGLPSSASAIARMAKRERWETRITTGRGGERQMYHHSALPRAAFAELLTRVMRAHAGPDGLPDPPAPAAPAPALAPPPAQRHAPGAPTPQWVLPLLRLLKAGEPTLEDAVRKLPSVMAPHVAPPSVAEARAVLAALGRAV